MPEKEDVDNMRIWQNHEQRITSLEITMTGWSDKMESVERTARKGKDEQKELLNTINNRMGDEFFKKKTINLNNGWKLLFSLIGGGSFLYLLIEKMFL